MKKSVLKFCILFIVAFVMIGSGCLTEEDVTFSLNEEIGYLGDVHNATYETLQPDLYYHFYDDSFDVTYFVNGNGKMFVNINDDYETYPIVLIPYYEENVFLWEQWFREREIEIKINSNISAPTTPCVSINGTIYFIGDIETVTPETLRSNEYYSFFENGYDITDGLVYINGNGEVFKSITGEYRIYPIELVAYEDEDIFDWNYWFMYW